MAQKFLDLPGRLQIAINMALAELDEDVFAEEVTRDGELLIVSVSGPGSDEIVKRVSLKFNHEDETYQVKVSNRYDR